MPNHIVTELYKDVVCVFFQQTAILDEVHIRAIGDELTGVVAAGAGGKYLLNFEGVDYLSSAMLGKLIALHKKTKSEHSRLSFCCIKPQIFDVFKVTKLDKVFDIYPDQAKALEAFAKS